MPKKARIIYGIMLYPATVITSTIVERLGKTGISECINNWAIRARERSIRAHGISIAYGRLNLDGIQDCVPFNFVNGTRLSEVSVCARESEIRNGRTSMWVNQEI